MAVQERKRATRTELKAPAYELGYLLQENRTPPRAPGRWALISDWLADDEVHKQWTQPKRDERELVIHHEII